MRAVTARTQDRLAEFQARQRENADQGRTRNELYGEDCGNFNDDSQLRRSCKIRSQAAAAIRPSDERSVKRPVVMPVARLTTGRATTSSVPSEHN